MARLARVVIPGLPHHVTQRGNRREAIFFEDGDHEVYLNLLAEQACKAGVAVWAYCLMPNHVHLILKPAHSGDLGHAVGEAHRRYTNFLARGRWTGHLFQSRLAGGPGPDDRFPLHRGCPRSLAFGDRGYRYDASVNLNSNAGHDYDAVPRLFFQRSVRAPVYFYRQRKRHRIRASTKVPGEKVNFPTNGGAPGPSHLGTRDSDMTQALDSVRHLHRAQDISSRIRIGGRGPYIPA